LQCIKYLEEDKHPIRRQTTESITKLLDELEKLDLTRAERLQIVNLAPTTLVALVVVRRTPRLLARLPSEPSQVLIQSRPSLGPRPPIFTSVATWQCVDDFEERFPSEEEQAHILKLVTDHMGTEQAPTIVLHPSEGGRANGTNGGDYDEPDDATYEQEDEEGDLVEEGLDGAGEATERGIDEEDA